MGLRPKYAIGEYVVDSEVVGGSESIVLIKERRPILEGLKVEWNYFGHEYELTGNPITLKYKTTITARESRFVTLSSRIVGP